MSISSHMNMYIYMHAQIHISINIVYRVYFAMTYKLFFSFMVISDVYRELWNTPNKALPGKSHGTVGHSKRNWLWDRAIFTALGHGKCSNSWWRHQIETFSALLAICAGNSPVTGEFPAQRPVTRSFDVFFDLRSNKRLSKQSWGWWFETQSCPLWRHCNVNTLLGHSDDKVQVWLLNG